MKKLLNNSLGTISIDNKLIPTGIHEFSKFNLTEESFLALQKEHPGLTVLLEKKILRIVDDNTSSTEDVQEKASSVSQKNSSPIESTIESTTEETPVESNPTTEESPSVVETVVEEEKPIVDPKKKKKR